MKILTPILTLSLFALPAFGADADGIMSEAYWKLWNPGVQARIDRDIEQNRKADGIFKLERIAVGTEVRVEQISHAFIFGAQIFNFNQLGTPERNRKYKKLFGTLFNSATIPFYWKTFEMEPGQPRFKEEERDTEAYWNAVADPKNQPHWRRPASDPVVEFCESKGIRLHGHTIVWGDRTWQNPPWLFETYCPADEKEKLNRLGKDGQKRLTPAQIAELAPVFTREMKRLFDKRMKELSAYYGGRIQSWDVVNESASDYRLGVLIPGNLICQSRYGLMPGDYTYAAFQLADNLFPKTVKLNINDYLNNADYAAQVKELLARGCRIDILGSQMHLYRPQECIDIAEGKPKESPEIVWQRMATLAQTGLPIHISEITITAPGNDARGREIQAIIARNLYRLWFSIKPMMGITWWNVVDGGGQPSDPGVSGLVTRDVDPKPAFHALNKLINEEWKTRMTVKAGNDGTVAFRGFRGRYRVSWVDAAGKVATREVVLE